jgi:hypothetical protein
MERPMEDRKAESEDQRVIPRIFLFLSLSIFLH